MKKDDCIFCKLANGDIPTNTLYEDDCVRVAFDIEPANSGHVLIIPKNHFDNVYSLDEDTAAHIFQVAVKVANVLKDTLHCEGLNILQNNGEVAGQTVFHFHMHVIPRYQNDGVTLGWQKKTTDAQTIALLQEKMKSEIQ